MSGFENIEQISNYEYLIGTTDGYYTININDLSFKITRLPFQILWQTSWMKILKVILSGRGQFRLWWKQYRFQLRFPNIKYLNAEYQYLLEGFQDDWSGWSTKTAVSFKTCLLASMCLKLGLNLQILYRVIPPSILSVLNLGIGLPSYSFYLIIGIVLARIIDKAYRSYYQRRKKTS
jgi:hypothetical protein